MEEFKNAGCNEVMIKPLNFDYFLSLLRKYEICDENTKPYGKSTSTRIHGGGSQTGSSDQNNQGIGAGAGGGIGAGSVIGVGVGNVKKSSIPTAAELSKLSSRTSSGNSRVGSGGSSSSIGSMGNSMPSRSLLSNRQSSLEKKAALAKLLLPNSPGGGSNSGSSKNFEKPILTRRVSSKASFREPEYGKQSHIL